MSVISLLDLFLDHVGPSMARHMALLEAIEGLPCHVDLKRGQVVFGNRFTFDAQLLGIEDQTAEAWTWSWAMPQSIVAPVVTQTARTLRAWGEENGLAAFVVGTFRTTELRGDEIALVACGIARSDSFLVADTELGTAYLLIPDVHGEIAVRHSATFLTAVISDTLSNYAIENHRRVVGSLLAFAGYDIRSSDGLIWQAHRSDGSSVTIEFDEQGRVAQLSVHDERGTPG